MTSWFSSAVASAALRFRLLSGFITVPGMISLVGIVLAIAVSWLDRVLANMQLQTLDLLQIPPENVRPLLSAIATSAMSALSLVYSSVLVVFTLAAGTLGPRLLLRFATDRVNQVAVGILGATFLYCIIAMRNQPADAPGALTINVAVALAAACVVMLLFFINSAARRVTIDEEISRIGKTLDQELDRAIGETTEIGRAAVIRPAGPEITLVSRSHGYVNQIDFKAIANAAMQYNAFVDFYIIPGSFTVEGQRIGVVIGAGAEELIPLIHSTMVFGERRTTADDLSFSINLLVEIALRALSPGVNDTFTAIACADRLAASLLRGRRARLQLGVYADEANAARVTAPQLSAGELIEAAFTPLRRAASNNMLMCKHLVRALGILGHGVNLPGEDAVRQQLELIRSEFEASNALDADIAVIRDLVEYNLTHCLGQELLDSDEP